MSYVPQVEICVEGIDEAVTADRAGADRVELCAGMTDGGLTPSSGVLREALARVEGAKIMAMVRPRGGDFLYTEAEFASMLADLAHMRDLGAPGAVAGCLTPDGAIDTARMQAIVAAAGPMDVTCHRAFDMVRDPFAALDALAKAGVSRVLTSGCAARAEDGLPLLRDLIRHAQGRIKILICGAFSPREIDPDSEGLTGYEVHFAQVEQIDSPMQYRNPQVFMGDDDAASEYTRRSIDPVRLAEQIARCRRTG